MSETTNFSYDSSYRLSSLSNPRGTIAYGYTAGDQLQTYQVNSDPSVAFAYYDDGSVKTITRSGDNPLTYYYLLTGQKSQVVYPNNSSVNLSYDDQGRLTGIINRKPDSNVLSSYSYGYDYNQATGSYSMKGYRTSMTDQLAQQEKYYFDNLYQLTRVDYGNGDMHQWSYDDIGNRVQQTVTPAGQGPIVTNYTYYQNSQSRNSQLLASDGTNSYTWDNNGNLLTKGSTNYTWDYDDRMTGISGGSVSASYAYDYQGERIKKTVGGVETGYLYQAEDMIKETSGGTVTNYLHGIGIDDPVYLDRSGAKSYYFGDGLGSIREMTDATGTVQNSYSYGAWGELRASSTTVANSYAYTGREFAEEGLYFYRARYMNPGLGRFLSKDSMELLNGLNRYSYGLLNPVNYVDSDGFQAQQTQLPNCGKKCPHWVFTEYANLCNISSKITDAFTRQCVEKRCKEGGPRITCNSWPCGKIGGLLGYAPRSDSIVLCPSNFPPPGQDPCPMRIIAHEMLHTCRPGGPDTRYGPGDSEEKIRERAQTVPCK